jgi:uncharacterized protein (TIGR03437 family)
MRRIRTVPVSLCLVLQAAGLSAATFGTVVAPPGGASYSDIVLDEARTRLYLLNTAVNRVDIYNYKTKAFVTAIQTDAQPVSAALSRDGRFLYVTAYTASTLDAIDLNLGLISARVSLPTNPEGVAVGADGRVLITGVGAGGSTTNTLLIYDPSPGAVNVLSNVPVAPTPATPPVLPAPSGRIYNSYRSRLLATPDGRFIVGVNGPSAALKDVFLYESASGTVLRARTVANLSTVLAIASDGSKFMAGGTLFDSATLQVLAQENTANAPFTYVTQAGVAAFSFNTQANQGGSVFSPDDSVIYAAFNVAPLGAARPNITELLVNDPDNLLITMGLQMPENLAGKMAIDAAGANVYAISDSGFIILPVSTISQSPLAVPQTRSLLLTNDTCGIFKAATGSVTLDNAGRGRFTATVAPAAATNTVVVTPGAPGQPPQVTTASTNPPASSVVNTGATPVVSFRFNTAITGPGTSGPSDFAIGSPEAINIPGTVHVYQNNRDSISSGTIIPVSTNALSAEGLTDILLDSARQRIYITNSGLNRLEVFDLKTQTFLTPIKVGQLPHAMAMGTDGNTLYVANTGGESVSVVDLAKGVQSGRIAFPAFPFNASLAIANPVAIAVSSRGPQFILSNGSWWKIDSTGHAIPRALNSAIFGTATTIPGGNPTQWTMAATPGGEYILVVNGAGTAYLYDYTVDDFTVTKQALTSVAGYIGPIAAGPQGRYYSVGGTFLNSSLTAVQSSTTGVSPTGRLVSAVTAVSASQVALFTVPVRASANAAASDAGLVELYNPATGASAGNAPAIEGPSNIVTGNGRASFFGRTMVYDAAASTAYVLTAAGLSIVRTGSAAGTSAPKPTVNTGGIVNLGDMTAAIAPGGLFSILGRNLGTGSTSGPPYPTLAGGLCVTLNNQLLPLSMTSPAQINSQVPVALAAGRYPLVIRNTDNQTISATTMVTVSRYAPAVLVDGNGQAAILHMDGKHVDQNKPGKRDETLLIYATGLGVTHGAVVTTGNAVPASPAATTDAVQVFFGNPLWKQSAMIVRSSVLLPGMVGVAQITVTVPGFHEKGSSLPVTLKIGGVSSSTTGSLAPYVSVN